ncbi:hypothetical protein KI387_002305, partial [Taxus chinensis]
TNTHDTDHCWHNSLKQGSSSHTSTSGREDFQKSKRRPRWRKQKGHLAAQQEDDESDEETSEGAHCSKNLVLVSQTSQPTKKVWLIDSGASKHMS